MIQEGEEVGGGGGGYLCSNRRFPLVFIKLPIMRESRP